MLVFVDESGDPGLKVGAGSSPFFVVTSVVFEDHDEANATDTRIGLLRRELQLHPRFEFRFNKCSKTIRTEFLRAVSRYEFFYDAIAVNKDPGQLWGDGFKHKESFYKYTCNLVFQNAKPHLADAIVVIDGSGSRDFRLQLENYLKKRVNTPGHRYIRKVKVQDSESNNLLQLADMVSGAFYRSLGQKTDADVYRRIVAHRELTSQIWPRKRKPPP